MRTKIEIPQVLQPFSVGLASVVFNQRYCQSEVCMEEGAKTPSRTVWRRDAELSRGFGDLQG